MNISDILAKKSGGSLMGNMTFDIAKQEVDYGFSLSRIKLTDLTYYTRIPLNLRGKLNGKIAGKIRKGNFDLDTSLELAGTRVYNDKYPNSHLDIKYQNKKLFSVSNCKK